MAYCMPIFWPNSIYTVSEFKYIYHGKELAIREARWPLPTRVPSRLSACFVLQLCVQCPTSCALESMFKLPSFRITVFEEDQVAVPPAVVRVTGWYRFELLVAS
ncbi:hypothetical protein KC19_5G118700 [Ceratodon purpureus]|uniref:Uncharacterized protein n=1 Tax=Ceratodon purpureus TaxID=3225 RepID=A0A8T0I1M8_CERPU|nr:hypothetical protein KC19_5G118700 [Ceratodon purpureus]